MKGYRMFGGLGLALAAAMLFASPSMAYQGASPVSVKAIYSDHVSSTDLSIHLAVLTTIEIRTGYDERDGGTVLIEKQKHSFTQARNVKAVKATTQAGWRSGRLRYLSAG